jgi:hypothetical protein
VCSIEDSDMTPANAPERQADVLPAETRYADSAKEAECRSKKYKGPDKDLDPFPDIHRRFCPQSISKVTSERQE